MPIPSAPTSSRTYRASPSSPMPNFAARSSASTMLFSPYAVLIAATVDAARRAVLEESATTMTRPTASTYGILGPDAVGRVFSLRRMPPADDLAHLVERHGVVRWDRGAPPPHRQEVVTHPCVNLVFEPHGAAVFGVQRRRDSRVLRGSGWAVGVKFRPGGFSGFLGRPVHEITDRAVSLGAVFGAAGDRLTADAATRPDAAGKIALAEAFLRERLPAPDPEVELVHAVVADMLAVDPGATVAHIAKRHAVSTRTLQRLFRRHVGVGPKWVLRRYRLQEAAEQLAAGERSDWTRLALDLGYFDHAHFIRDFRAVVGRSPAEYEAQCAAPAAGWARSPRARAAGRSDRRPATRRAPPTPCARPRAARRS